MKRTLLLVFLPLLLAGCSSLAARGLLPDVQARRPANVQLGRELTLADTAPSRSTSFIDADGRVHVFLVDRQKQLRHIELFHDELVVQEVVGTLETAAPAALDAVEQSAGKLRVLAGDKQFVRSSRQSPWREINGNRCARFLAVAENLLCAFVIKGEEIGAPARKDWTVGWFILVPLAWWSNTQAAKLVVAQLSDERWIIRAVLDADSPLDANRDFMVDTDNEGNIYFLYFASRGGGMFALVVGAAPGAVGGGFQGPAPELKYVRVSLDRLIAPASALSEPVPSSATRISWESIPATNLKLREVLSQLNKRYALNKATGEVSGLLWGNLTVKTTAGIRRFEFTSDAADCCSWTEARIRDGSWVSGEEVVATPDLPDMGYEWSRDDAALLKSDARGNLCALLEHGRPGFWTASYSMAYLAKNASDWSAPITLGSSSGGDTRTLAVSDSGISFAAWVDKEGNFVGRSIRPAN
jgi:hypothetical protein